MDTNMNMVTALAIVLQMADNYMQDPLRGDIEDAERQAKALATVTELCQLLCRDFPERPTVFTIVR